MTENSSDDVNHITILNDEGEPVGLAVNNDENIPSGGGGGVRKRRPSTKIREILQGEPVNKKSGKPSLINNLFPLQQQQTTRHSVNNQRNEVELDISEVDCIRLKSNNNTINSKLAERQDELFQYIQRVDEKLDAILKHFNVPFSASPQIVSLDLKTHHRESPSRFITSSASVSSSIPSNSFVNRFVSTASSSSSRSRGVPATHHSFYTNTQDIHTIGAERQEQQEITQYVISDDLLESTHLRSRNRGNFAKNLVYAAFPLEERLGRNCYGRRGGSISGPKEPLEAAKLDAVREAVFRKYPAPPLEEESIWKKECVIAIDTALRSEMRQRFLAINGDLG